MFAFKYEIDQCEVIDKERLRRFREASTKWRDLLDGEDVHSIWKQIFDLFWRDSVFRMVNDLREAASESPSANVGFNGPVIGVFDAGFACMQAMTIRRLIEPQSGRPERAVVSLCVLLDDISCQRELITRENYVSGDGLPYDYGEVRDSWLADRREKGVTAGTVPSVGPEAWAKSEMLHKAFDRLSGVNAKTRSRTDVIRSELFAACEERLGVCDDVELFTHKFIAHAADPANREQLTDEQERLTLNKLNSCSKALYQVAEFIGALVGNGALISPIPTPQYDHLENLDKKWATSASIELVRKKWYERVKETESWQNDLWPS